jgi:deoxyribonuclease V
VPVRVTTLHPFDLPPKDAARLQSWLAAKVITKGTVRRKPRLIAGLDCSIGRDGHVHGVVVVCEAPDWHVVETVSSSAPAPMPYIPGLLSFREAPILLDALRRLRSRPDLILVDGHGIAHPRRLGIASHIGLHVDVPVVGVAKSRLVGEHGKVGKKYGDWHELTLGGRRIGLLLTTREGCKPLYISVGNRIALFPAARRVLACVTRYRLPEPIRHADALSRKLARAGAVTAKA